MKLETNSFNTSYSDIRKSSNIDGSRKRIQESYKSFEKNVDYSSQQSIDQKITILEDIVKKHLAELMNILQKEYEFIVSRSSKDSNKIVVLLVNCNSKEVKKEIPSEDFLRMTKYIEDIFYVQE